MREHRPGVAGRDRAHRHVVLLVRARRDASRPRPDGRGPCSRRRGPPPCTAGSSAPNRGRDRGARNAGSPPFRRASSSSAVRRSLIEPSSAIASFAKSSASAIGSPWKLPPLITRPPPVASASASADAALREDERVVGRAVHLDVEDAPEVVERVADRAVDLRHAAQRVRVLDLVGEAPCGWPGARSRAGGGAARRRPRSGPGAAGRAGRPRRTRRPCRAAPRRSSPRRRSRSGSAGRRRPGAAPRSPVISCVPLRSASPSFASRTSGSRPTSRSATSAGTCCPPSSTRPRPMSGSARWASGARSPDAPTEPCSGTTGWMPRVEEREQPVDDERPAAAVAERERVRPEQEHRPDDLARAAARRRPPRGSSGGSPGAAPRPPGGIEPGRQGAEPGRDAVDDLARGDEPLDDVARLLHPAAGRVVEGHAGAVAGDRLDVGDRQVGAGQDDRVGPAWGRSGRSRWRRIVGYPRPRSRPRLRLSRGRPCSPSSTRSSSRS